MDVRRSAPPVPYRLGDVRVDVRCDEDGMAGAVAAVLDYFGLRRRPPADGPPDVQPTVHLVFAAGGPAPSPSAEARLVTQHNGVDVWHDAEGWLLQEQGNAVRLDLAVGTAWGVIPSLPWATPGTLRLPFVNLVIHSLLLLLRPKGYWPLHAAALAKGETGLLLVAPSDSGKSTQALGLVRAGWRYLTDDSVLLRSAPGGIEALPLRRDFGLDDEAHALFPEIAPHQRPFLTDERKRRIDMAALRPEGAAERCAPRLLLFPHIAGQPQSELHPLSRKEALFGLMQQSVLLALDPDTTAPHLDALRRLAGQAEAYRLRAGQDLKHHPERLADLLKPVLPTAT